MTDQLEVAKEWLADLNKILSRITLKENKEDFVFGKKRIEAFEWLIEQAEQVRKLEDAIKGSAVVANIASDEIKELKEQNKRYREALEFYGNKYNHMQTMDSFADSGRGSSLVMQDGGLKAREALESDPNA